MFRWLRWKLAKWDLAVLSHKRSSRVWLRLRKCRDRLEDFPPTAGPYRLMAPFWDEYAKCHLHQYGRFLAAAAKYYGVAIQSVLDLACGTGLLTRQVARRAARVVGLDATDAMLQQAQMLTQTSNVQYVLGDFRHFDLGEAFAAVICGSDSLNYVESLEDLVNVFGCVHRHLQPAGLFIFDVLGHRGFLSLTSYKTEAEVDSEPFEVYYFYDLNMRVGESRAVFENGIERHRRIPIEVHDVQEAATKTGVELVEHFSSQIWDFYILRRPG